MAESFLRKAADVKRIPLGIFPCDLHASIFPCFTVPQQHHYNITTISPQCHHSATKKLLLQALREEPTQINKSYLLNHKF